MDAKQNLQIQRVNAGILYVGSHTAPVRAFQIDSQLPRLKIQFFRFIVACRAECIVM